MRVHPIPATGTGGNLPTRDRDHRVATLFDETKQGCLLRSGVQVFPGSYQHRPYELTGAIIFANFDKMFCYLDAASPVTCKSQASRRCSGRVSSEFFFSIETQGVTSLITMNLEDVPMISYHVVTRPYPLTSTPCRKRGGLVDIRVQFFFPSELFFVYNPMAGFLTEIMLTEQGLK